MNHLMPGAPSEFYFHSGSVGQKHKNNSFFTLPSIFVRLNHRISEPDSVRSPNSPLAFRMFSNFSNSYRHPISQNKGYQKRWACSKVGLSIIDSISDDAKRSGNVIRSSDSKRIIFDRKMSIRSLKFCSRASFLETPKSLPKDIAIFPNTPAKRVDVQKGSSRVLFEIGEAPFELDSSDTFRAFSLDSGRCRSRLTNFENRKSRLGSGNFVPENTIQPMSSESKFLERCLRSGSSRWVGEPSSIPPSIYSVTDFIDSIPDTEIELSEDYTCVRTHGPNPKVTHIFGDRILNHPNDDATIFSPKKEDITLTPDVLDSFTSNDFLKFCCTCQKKLDGEDIYMYRGEKAFCSYSCRSQEIEIDEETDDQPV